MKKVIVLLMTLVFCSCSVIEIDRDEPRPILPNETPTNAYLSIESTATQPSETPTLQSLDEITSTPGIQINNCIINPVKAGSDEERGTIEEIIDKFLMDGGLISLEEVGQLAKAAHRYSNVWFLVKESETGSVDLTFDVVFLGSYWVDIADDYSSSFDEIPGDVLQIALFYNAEFDLILRGIISAQINGHWGVLPIIMKDNAVELAKNGVNDIKVTLASKCQSSQWLVEHVGQLANISLYMYFDNFKELEDADLFSSPLLDLLMEPAGYISEFSKTPPIVTEGSIPYIIASIQDENPGLIVMGISPYGERLVEH